ncbi:MAG: NADH-quinone oxidoreductase subunit J [Elusimicrobiota bacterium]
MIEKVLFYIIALISIISTIYIFFSKDLFKNLIAVFLIFFTTGLIYFHMGIVFLGVFQIIIYAGAIMILFVVAMNVISEDKTTIKFNKPSIITGILSSVIFIILSGLLLYKIFSGLHFDYSKKISFMEVSKKLFEVFPVQIEIISLILFVAIVIVYSLLRSSDNEL